MTCGRSKFLGLCNLFLICKVGATLPPLLDGAYKEAMNDILQSTP